jgi:hypothetical protein
MHPSANASFDVWSPSICGTNSVVVSEPGLGRATPFMAKENRCLEDVVGCLGVSFDASFDASLIEPPTNGACVRLCFTASWL